MCPKFYDITVLSMSHTVLAMPWIVLPYSAVCRLVGLVVFGSDFLCSLLYINAECPAVFKVGL